MRIARGVVRLVWGEDLDPAIGGVVAASFAATAALSAFWTFIGIWAATYLGATSAQIGFMFLLDALAAGLAGYVGGHLSDYLGRRPLMLFSLGAQAVLVPLFVVIADRLVLGIALVVVVAAVGTPGVSAGQAIVADLVPVDRHESAYAAMRVAYNVGVVCGPPVGGLLLLGDSWSRFFFGVAALTVLALVLAQRILPASGEYAPEGPPTRRSLAVIRSDRLFLVFLVASVLASVVYFSFETALPITLTTTYGVSPATWGFLVVINALAVTLFQIRLTRRVRRFSSARKWIVAMLLMGFPFLLLTVDASLATIIVVLVVFVVGEMLWAPTSQAIAARLAPADVRGAYMGAFTTTGSVAFALGPFAALQLRQGFGDGAMWVFFALVSLLAAAIGAGACRAATGRARDLPAAAGGVARSLPDA